MEWRGGMGGATGACVERRGERRAYRHCWGGPSGRALDTVMPIISTPASRAPPFSLSLATGMSALQSSSASRAYLYPYPLCVPVCRAAVRRSGRTTAPWPWSRASTCLAAATRCSSSRTSTSSTRVRKEKMAYLDIDLSQSVIPLFTSDALDPVCPALPYHTYDDQEYSCPMPRPSWLIALLLLLCGRDGPARVEQRRVVDAGVPVGVWGRGRARHTLLEGTRVQT